MRFEAHYLTEAPIVAYHGTDSKFDRYDTSKLGSMRGKTPSNMAGFFFSDNKEVAQSFGKYLMSAQLDIKKPLIIDAKGKNYSEFKHKLNDILSKVDKKKYDGVIIKNYVDSMEDEPQSSTQYVVFNPEQIKIVNEKDLS